MSIEGRPFTLSERLAMAMLSLTLVSGGVVWLVRIESTLAVQAAAQSTSAKDVAEIKADIKEMRTDVRNLAFPQPTVPARSP